MLKNYFCFDGVFEVAYEGAWHVSAFYEVVCRSGRFIVREIYGNGRHKFLYVLSNTRTLAEARDFIAQEWLERNIDA